MRPLVLFACIAAATALGVGRPAAQTRSSAAPPPLTYKGFNYVSYYNGAYENADSLRRSSRDNAGDTSIWFVNGTRFSLARHEGESVQCFHPTLLLVPNPLAARPDR
jgi:hypothetical protein